MARFSSQTKVSAIKRVVETGHSIRDVCTEMEIGETTLRRWIKQWDAECTDGERPSTSADERGDGLPPRKPSRLLSYFGHVIGLLIGDEKSRSKTSHFLVNTPEGRRVTFIVSVIVLIALSAPTVGRWIIQLNSNEFWSALESVTPPELPKQEIFEEQRWLDQGWSIEEREEFHRVSLGTRSLGIPYQWFVSLAPPVNGAVGILFDTSSRFSHDEYLLRFGFIKGEMTEDNPDALPIGLAITRYQTVEGLDERADVVGYNCATCHTGNLVHNGIQYVIEGGGANVDLTMLQDALTVALVQTALSGRLSIFDGRFERFARNVLGAAYSYTSKSRLLGQLESVLKERIKSRDRVKVNEGFSRFDWLNRYGNLVFSRVYPNPVNYAPIDAPVNFPHIWTSEWFEWQLYDASVMSPTELHIGEVLSADADLVFNTSKSAGLHISSSASVSSLSKIGYMLAGNAFGPTKQYTGLRSPKWPQEFGLIDESLAEKGASLYAMHCQGCHLPPLDEMQQWGERQFVPIYWTDANGKALATQEYVLRLPILPVDQIGTDVARVDVNAFRMIDTSFRIGSTEHASTLPLDVKAMLCSLDFKGDPILSSPSLVTIPYNIDGRDNVAMALSAVAQQTVNNWLSKNYIAKSEKAMLIGDRPNCIQTYAGYRARPLNGIWATAPFLHNGSVPTLMDLLSPEVERPKLVQLGSPIFDVEKVGIRQNHYLRMRAGEPYTDNGLFVLDTSLRGNGNGGHEFSEAWDPTKSYDQQPSGVIGPLLSMEERLALIEYLKTL